MLITFDPLGDCRPYNKESAMLHEVQPYMSPTMTVLALLSQEPDEKGVVAVIFDYIPLWKRAWLAIKIHVNFLVKKGHLMVVHYDRLIMPDSRVATGIRLVPQG